MARALAALAIVLLCVGARASETSEGVAVNPIRRVVSMLQNIQAKVSAEAERDEGLHSKYICYCKTGAGSLEQSIAEAETKIDNLDSSLAEAQSNKKQLIADLDAHTADRTEAKAAIAKATSLRNKEAGIFAKFKSDSETNVAAISKAVTSLEKGVGAAFVQTGSAQTLRNVLLSKDMSDGDRDDVMAFLSGEYAPQSGQIIGILKQLGDDMTADLKAASASEDASIQSFDSLMTAKSKEIGAATQAIEAKSIRLGETSVSIAEMTGDHSDTTKSLGDDRKFLADLETNCANAQEKYDAIFAERSAELVALAETVKLLNDDDALSLFKRTLPSASASFVQVQVRFATVRARALASIKAAHQPSFDFLALALNGKKIGFGKIITMIEEMQVHLKREQQGDDEKKAYCEKKFDTSDDKKKSEERSVSDATAAIDDAKATLAKLAEETKALQDSVRSLDQSVQEATAQRKAEHAEFAELIASDTAAKELIHMAKNRLYKFYDPRLYAPPPKTELSEAERIAVSLGETLAPTPAPGGIAGTDITAFSQVSSDVEPPPAPAQASYAKKSGESGGVIAMLDLLVKDLDQEMQTAEASETDAQRDYEQAMSDAASQRADATTTLGHKASATADTEAALQSHQDDHAAHTHELLDTLRYIQSLHGECDWLLQYFSQRKEARTSEINALGNAKAVLSGSDYALLQVRSRSLRGRV